MNILWKDCSKSHSSLSPRSFSQGCLCGSAVDCDDKKDPFPPYEIPHECFRLVQAHTLYSLLPCTLSKNPSFLCHRRRMQLNVLSISPSGSISLLISSYHCKKQILFDLSFLKAGHALFWCLLNLLDSLLGFHNLRKQMILPNQTEPVRSFSLREGVTASLTSLLSHETMTELNVSVSEP